MFPLRRSNLPSTSAWRSRLTACSRAELVCCWHRGLCVPGRTSRANDQIDEKSAPNLGKQDARPASMVAAWMEIDRGTKKQLATLAVGQSVAGMSVAMMVPVLPAVAEQWGTAGAGSTIGLILAAPALARLLLNSAAGRLVDTRGRVPLMACGALLSAAGNFGSAVSSSLSGVVAARFMDGTGTAGHDAASETYVADITTRYPQHRGLMMGTVASVGATAYALGPGIGGALADNYGCSFVFGASGCAMLFVSVVYSQLPETLLWKPAPPATPSETAGAAAVGLAGDNEGFVSMIATSKSLQALVALDLAVFLSIAVAATAVPLHASVVWDATPGALGLLMSGTACAGIVAAPVGGWISDQVGRPAAIVGGASLLACSAFLLGSGLVANVYSFGMTLALWDFGEGLSQAAINAFAADVAAPEKRGRVFALRSQVDSGVMLVAPVMVGLIIDHSSTGTGLVLAACCMSMGIATFVWLQRSSMTSTLVGKRIKDRH